MEVSENGDIKLENSCKMVKEWEAMDLVASREYYCSYDNTNRQGESKILKNVRLPITGVNCVKKIVTNLGF